MVFLIKKIYHPASEIPRCVKFNDKLSLDNCILLALRLIGDPLCSHVMVGSGLGVCRRVTENEVFSFICFVLFRVEVMYTTGGTGEREEYTKEMRLVAALGYRCFCETKSFSIFQPTPTHPPFLQPNRGPTKY